MRERGHDELTHVPLVEDTSALGDFAFQIEVGQPDLDKLGKGRVRRELAGRDMAGPRSKHGLQRTLR